MSVTLYSKYYYKGHQIILTDLVITDMNTNNYIDFKYYLPIKSVKNNSDYIIQITGRQYAHCVLPKTSEPKIIGSFAARFNIVLIYTMMKIWKTVCKYVNVTVILIISRTLMQ